MRRWARVTIVGGAVLLGAAAVGMARGPDDPLPPGALRPYAPYGATLPQPGPADVAWRMGAEPAAKSPATLAPEELERPVGNAQAPIPQLRPVADPTPAAAPTRQFGSYCNGPYSATAGARMCGPQMVSPAAPCPICAVDCAQCRCGRGCGHVGWQQARLIAWQSYAQGEYVGHARLAHVSEYRLRVDDQLDMIYRITREETAQPYKLNVGDEVRVESFTDADLNRDLILQPDGTITLRLLGQVHATGLTVPQLREELEKLYTKYYKVPSITVIPLRMNTKLEDLRATVDRRAGVGGQSQLARITPEGTIALPAIGSVCAQGLTLGELQQELNERYRTIVEGIEVVPVLFNRAPRFVYVLGEVRAPGRFTLEGPTTVMQALSMAGGWTVGSNLRQVVVFRRGDDWRLMATQLNLQAPLYGNQPCPPSEIWLSDSDIVVVPKNKMQIADEFIELAFTRGIYGVIPMQGISMNFAKLSTL